MKRDHYKLYFERYLEGTASTEEIGQLKMLLQQDPEIASYLERQMEESTNRMDAEQTERLLKSIKQKAQIPLAMRPTTPSIGSNSLSFVLRIAATILLPLLSAYGTYLYLNRSEAVKSSDHLLVKVERGQKAQLVLPDGSKAWLNSDSELSYSNDYNQKTRSLYLKGEGYFEVEKDDRKPFVITTKDMSVEVLGTTFGVKAYEEDDVIYTSLKEGEVRMKTSSGEAVLHPKDRFIYDRRTRTNNIIKEVNIEDYLGWKENRMRFDNQTLEQISVQLKRIYNIEIRFATEKIKSYRFSGTIDNNSLDSVFYILSLTSPILYDLKQGEVILTEDPRRKEFYH